MRGGIAAVVVIVAIFIGAGIGYLTGNANERSVTFTSTNTTTSLGTITSVYTTASLVVVTSVSTIVVTNSNESALLRQEVALLGQIGGDEISVSLVNVTWTVEPNQTVLANEEVNQYNGSIVFIGYSCPDGAGSQSNTNGLPGFTVLLSNKSLIPSRSENVSPINSTTPEWAVYLKNIGPTTVQCTASLFFVYHVP